MNNRMSPFSWTETQVSDFGKFKRWLIKLNALREIRVHFSSWLELCFFNYFLPQVLKAAPDVSTQYMPIMNCIFAAQKSVRES